jgi:hypothetical protein
MALNKTGLKTALIAAFTSQYDGTPSAGQVQGIEDLATALSNAIDTYVKTATVNVTSVTGVTTGAGVSGPGTGTLS